FKESSIAVPRLLDRTLDRDASPRIKAVMALRYVEVERSQIPSVVKRLASKLTYSQEHEVQVRYEAARTLQRFMKDAAPAIPSLILASRDGSFEMRHICVGMLWRLGMESKHESKERRDITEALLQRMADSTTAVRLEAITGVAALGRP